MKRIYPKEEVCIACRLCEVYCQAEHSNTRDVIRAFKVETPRPDRRIFMQQEGVVSLAINCRHCDEPECVYACIAGALIKSETGLVEFNVDKCIGCWTCILACPYGVITRDSARAKVAKCDFCPERQIPACVAVCPNGALLLAEV
ncbi:MAG: 4Fe-4S dicluster domain-containing protein [Chloroflexi bacterium]|nr:4Fe-4S dicluster domain-containing protein [Chloroflexota bacterium]